jgi:TPR repeat protein
VLAVWSVFAIASAGERADNFDLNAQSGRWDQINGVRELFPTAIGRAYEFEYTNPFMPFPGKISGSEWQKEWEATPISALRYNVKLRDKKNQERFFAADFSVRQFPAMGETEPLRFHFTFFLSSRDEPEQFCDLDHAVRFMPAAIALRGRLGVDLADYASERIGRLFLPRHENLNCRMLVDRSKNEVSVSLNGYRKIFCGRKIMTDPIRSIGIFIEQDQSRPSRRVEFSAPRIYQFDDPAVLEKLPPVTFSCYPYENYASLREAPTGRKSSIAKNPDAWYAEALEKLEQPSRCDPPAGVELLKKAAKADHVLAMYQLGVCYYRGHGVARDDDSALKYLRQAEKAGSLRASVLTMTILTGQCRDRIYVSPKIQEEILRKSSARYFSFDSMHDVIFSNHAFFNETIGGIGPTYTPPGYRKAVEHSEKLDFAGKLFADHAKIVLSSAEAGFDFKSLLRIDYSRCDDATYYRCLLCSGMRGGNPAAYLRAAELLMFIYARNARPEYEYLRNQAMTLLSRISEQKDPDCQLLLLLLQFETGKLDPKAFTQEADLRLGDQPLYWFLKNATGDADLPGLAEIRNHELSGAVEKMKGASSFRHRFLFGLLQLHVRFFLPNRSKPHLAYMADPHRERHGDSGVEAVHGKTYIDPTAEAREPYRQIIVAAQNGLPDAQYWMAKLQLRSAPDCTKTPACYNDAKAVAVLEELARNGDAAAVLLLAEYALDTGRVKISPAMEGQLIQLGDSTGYAKIWLLLSRLNEKRNDLQRALAYDLKSGESGEPQGFSRAALRSKGVVAQEYWRRFIPLDRAVRARNWTDPYSRQININQAILDGREGAADHTEAETLSPETEVRRR